MGTPAVCRVSAWLAREELDTDSRVRLEESRGPRVSERERQQLGEFLLSEGWAKRRRGRTDGIRAYFEFRNIKMDSFTCLEWLHLGFVIPPSNPGSQDCGGIGEGPASEISQ